MNRSYDVTFYYKSSLRYIKIVKNKKFTLTFRNTVNQNIAEFETYLFKKSSRHHVISYKIQYLPEKI